MWFMIQNLLKAYFPSSFVKDFSSSTKYNINNISYKTDVNKLAMRNFGIQSLLKHLNKVVLLLHCAIMISDIYAVSATKLTKNTLYNLDSESNNVKYILLWEANEAFKNVFGEGQEIFLQSDCPVDNCFISSNKKMFGGDLRKFDAILFNGWDLNWYNKKRFPDKRYSHQKYAYVQRESAANTYVCHTGFDDFFNWTITYKLDSDIVFPHIRVRDRNDNVIGPNKNMQWISNMPEVDATIAADLESKKKAAAWFYINCEPSNANRNFVEKLQKALYQYGLKIDVYGKCGPLHCSMYECDQMLDKDYYFYLALEESFAEDYVTGNILRALRNNVVPVVYGGAKYSRFLPPESYLDGTSQTPEELASLMNILVKNQTMYKRYFRWKSYYSFSLGQANPSLPLEGMSYTGPTMCDLCQALHDPKKFNVRSAYKDFRKWWYPKYAEKCAKKRTAKLASNPQTRSEKKGKPTTTTPPSQNPKRRKKKTQKKTKGRNEKKTMNENKLMDERNAMNPMPLMKQITQKDNGWLSDKEKLKNKKASVLRRTFAGLPNRVAEGLVHGLVAKMIVGPGDAGQGGGGGGVVRNGGQVANEFNRIRVSICVNNFDIYRR